MRGSAVVLAIVAGCGSPAVQAPVVANVAADAGPPSTPAAAVGVTAPVPAIPKTVPFQRGGVTLSLGDSATSGEWTIKWTEAHGPVVTLDASHRSKSVDRWQAVLDKRPSHEAASDHKLFHFEVTLTAVKGEADAPGATITITGDAVDRAVPAKFGQSLKPGLYTFPDGLRMRVEQLTACDFDTSVPCFGGTYRAIAVKGSLEGNVDWRTKTTKVLGYTITLANFEFSVQK